MPNGDPLRLLQDAARHAANHICPGVQAGRVVVIAPDGQKLLDVTVPPAVLLEPESQPEKNGWEINDKRVTFDGRPIPVGALRIKLLKVLVHADGPLAAKELAKLAFNGRGADEESVRYHIRELRKELQLALELDSDPIPGEGGYRLIL